MWHLHWSKIFWIYMRLENFRDKIVGDPTSRVRKMNDSSEEFIIEKLSY